MTAAGLAVAIPAVLAYNVFGQRVGRSEADLEGFAHDLREMIVDAARMSARRRASRAACARPLADMAFGRLERTRGAQPMSDINMTPLIDVMLVLLVIFIITAPLMASSSLKLDLPQDRRGPAQRRAAVRRRRPRQGRPHLPRRRGRSTPAALRRAARGGGAAQSGDRGPAARRPERALRPGGRADGRRPEGRAEPDRLRRRARGRASGAETAARSESGRRLAAPMSRHDLHFMQEQIQPRRGRARRPGRTGPRATPTA